MSWKVQVYMCLSLRAASSVKTCQVWSRHLEVHSFFSSLGKRQLMMCWNSAQLRRQRRELSHFWSPHLYLPYTTFLSWKVNMQEFFTCLIFKISMLAFFFPPCYLRLALGETDLKTPSTSLWAVDELPQCALSTAQWYIKVWFIFLCLIRRLWHLSVCIHVQSQKCLTFFGYLLTLN